MCVCVCVVSSVQVLLGYMCFHLSEGRCARMETAGPRGRLRHTHTHTHTAASLRVTGGCQLCGSFLESHSWKVCSHSHCTLPLTLSHTHTHAHAHTHSSPSPFTLYTTSHTHTQQSFAIHTVHYLTLPLVEAKQESPKHTCIHTHMHTHMHTHTHTHTCTRIHTHT